MYNMKVIQEVKKQECLWLDFTLQIGTYTNKTNNGSTLLLEQVQVSLHDLHEYSSHML